MEKQEKRMLVFCFWRMLVLFRKCWSFKQVEGDRLRFFLVPTQQSCTETTNMQESTAKKLFWFDWSCAWIPANHGPGIRSRDTFLSNTSTRSSALGGNMHVWRTPQVWMTSLHWCLTCYRWWRSARLRFREVIRTCRTTSGERSISIGLRRQARPKSYSFALSTPHLAVTPTGPVRPCTYRSTMITNVNLHLQESATTCLQHGQTHLFLVKGVSTIL